MNYPRQVILQKVREQRKLKSLMILKQSSTLFKKCIYLHKHYQYVKGKHVLCSWHLGQQHGFKHKSFLLKKACTSKATKSSLKDPRTASASLTHARLPKPVELQSLLLQWLHGVLLQKHCISEFFKLETISETQCTGKQKWDLCSNSTRLCFGVFFLVFFSGLFQGVIFWSPAETRS